MHHIQLGLEREISDEEEEDEGQQSQFIYETEEDLIMGAEGDIEYTEEQERLEAERADPAPFTEEDQLSNIGIGGNPLTSI